MRTGVECLSCFVQQAARTAEISSQDVDVRSRVVAEVEKLLPQLDPSLSPPENSVAVYGKIAEITGVRDPYAAVKKKENEFAAGLRDQVRFRISGSGDPLYTAVRYAIAANIIDYGTRRSFDALASLERCLAGEMVIDDFGLLAEAINGKANPSVLYLADNCGEIIFDGLLIEQLQLLGCRVTLAVRGDVILNDATLEDIADCGMDALCPVLTSGTGCPGTPVISCSAELQNAFAHADIIISKGQGNFETLSGTDGPLFFLLTVKCRVVARHISTKRRIAESQLKGRGEMILMREVGSEIDAAD